MTKYMWNLPILNETLEPRKYLLRYYRTHNGQGKWRNLFFFDEPITPEQGMKLWRTLGYGDLKTNEYLALWKFNRGRFGKIIWRIPRIDWSTLEGRKRKQLIEIPIGREKLRAWQVYDEEDIDKELLEMLNAGRPQNAKGKKWYSGKSKYIFAAALLLIISIILLNSLF
jgi:hypothetical protein